MGRRALIGGAVLGAYPHIAYDAFLRRLCDDAGVVVVATLRARRRPSIDRRAVPNLFADAWGAVAARGDPTAAPVFAAGLASGVSFSSSPRAESTESGNGDGDPDDVEGFSAAADEDVSEHVARARGHLFVVQQRHRGRRVRLLGFARELIRKRAERVGRDPSASAAFEGSCATFPA